MRAIDVLTAAKKTFSVYGNEEYAKGKANSFLRRCGVLPEHSMEKRIELDRIKQIVYAMLDAEAEKVLWAHLGVEVK